MPLFVGRDNYSLDLARLFFVALRVDAVREHVSWDGDGGVVVPRVLDLHLALAPLLSVLKLME